MNNNNNNLLVKEAHKFYKELCLLKYLKKIEFNNSIYIVVAGHAYGKVRALENDIQEKIQKCFPSQPVVIYGFKQVPQ
ncbi:MAG: hypothetical protein Q8881_03205, partial [Sweet potato little leaf phytoplasma]|nr:hypothetical protein [Sweet potato little leaf phytoplasma]